MLWPIHIINISLLVASVTDLDLRLEKAGVHPEDIVVAFLPTQALEELIQDTTAAHEKPKNKADAIYDLMQSFKQEGRWFADKDNSPKARKPKTALDMLELIPKNAQGNRDIGCYEFSSFFIAAARSVGLDAFGVEKKMKNGGGQIGHVMAAIRYGPKNHVWTYDLQNDRRGPALGVKVLSDLEFAAHHYNHLSVASYLQGDLKSSSRMIAYARQLFPESASFLNNSATVFSAQGEHTLALAEVLAAVYLEPSNPLFRYQLGRIFLEQGELKKAQAQLRKALSLKPGYAIALRDLGWLKILLGDGEAGEALLLKARKSDKLLPEASLFLALYFLREKKEAALKALMRELKTQDLHRSEMALITKLQHDVQAGADIRGLQVALKRLKALHE
ncbi:MAG: tetratricopeptide repeat protein [Myxococcota bacterium]|jgi:tetratricopeptide (TPR) repeat protein|nr:tetratricopeptide repeat protein [Myxococcota bacterium]